MKVAVKLDIPDNCDVEKLVTLAVRKGYQRIEPRKAWSDKERKEAIRYAVVAIVNMHL